MTDMDKMTMRDYAKRCGVTYECVRRTVNKELKNNPVFEKYVHKLGRTTYLDSRAVEYLDTRGRGNKASYSQKVNEIDRQIREIEDLKSQVEELKKKANELEAKYNSEREKRELLQDELHTQAMGFIDKLYDIAMESRGVDVKCLNKTDKPSDDNDLIEVAL